MPSLPTRRMVLAGMASLSLWGARPTPAIAGTRDPRLLVIILRGGLDGLATVAPVADPDYAVLRGEMAIPTSGEGSGLPLDGFFSLNSAMPTLHALYARRQATIVRAVHTPYRARSHFDGQDVLESGLAGVAKSDDGWLNRALSLLPSAGPVSPRGLAIGAVVPLTIRGKAQTLSWIPKVNAMPLRASTIARLIDLYAQTDPVFAKAFAEGVEIGRIADAGAFASGEPAAPGEAIARLNHEFTDPAEAAARFLAAPEGPRIGVLSYNGWDTHAREGVLKGQLANRLGGLDAALNALERGLGTAWQDTVALVITEFGRTARRNGSEGTDHGMATLALVVGGAVSGGRVVADWPGLSDAALYEARDLRPTRDLRSILKGVLRDHLGVSEAARARMVFPDSFAVKPLGDLIA
jgi:uncharacterized protein (DUF1501 family)